MSAIDRTPIGPELALLSPRTPLSLQDARIRGVLYDELDGASAEWTLGKDTGTRTVAHVVPAGRSRFWVRLFGRRGSLRAVGRPDARADGCEPLGFPGPTPAQPTGGRR
jgi:hypothetical protein